MALAPSVFLVFLDPDIVANFPWVMCTFAVVTQLMTDNALVPNVKVFIRKNSVSPQSNSAMHLYMLLLRHPSYNRLLKSIHPMQVFFLIFFWYECHRVFFWFSTIVAFDKGIFIFFLDFITSDVICFMYLFRVSCIFINEWQEQKLLGKLKLFLERSERIYSFLNCLSSCDCGGAGVYSCCHWTMEDTAWTSC